MPIIPPLPGHVLFTLLLGLASLLLVSRLLGEAARRLEQPAVICELLGGALSGGRTLHERSPGREIINNMFSIIIDPQRLGTAANLAAEAAEFADWVKASPLAQGADRIKLPGEPEQNHRRERGANGISIDPTTWTEIIGAAGLLGLKQREVEQLAGLG